jgi:hypothetical protein
MYLLIKSAFCVLLGALLVGCAPKQSVTETTFYNIDSLVSAQINTLKSGKHQLSKLVEIDGKQETTQLVPDSIQWANDIEIFRQLAQVNKASFRTEYSVNDVRDTNSNLMVREIKSTSDVPVPLVRLYYLRNLGDLRKVEATLVEENTLYINTRRMIMEFERVGNTSLLHRYRIESVQKFVAKDTARFVIAGEISI